MKNKKSFFRFLTVLAIIVTVFCTAVFAEAAVDVNGDGLISAADARFNLRTSTGLTTLTHVHSYGTWTAEKDSAGAVTGRHYKECSTCANTVYADCSYGTKTYTVNATCTTAASYTQTCSVCNGEKTGSEAALGHSWDGGTVTKAATCTVTGTKKFTCTRTGCTATKTATVATLAHTPVKVAAKAATCTTEGNKLYYRCKVCNRVFTASDCKTWVTYKSRIIAALGHSWNEGTVTKAATCTSTGSTKYTCTRTGCTATKTVTVAALAHTPVKVAAKAATCTTEGNKLYYRCKVCNRVFTASDCKTWVTYKSRIIAALGHSWDEGTVIKAATCTASGTTTYTCTREGCTATKTETVAALGHSPVEYKAKAATCTTGGNKLYYKCKNCNKVFNAADCKVWVTYKSRLTAALGHSWDEGTVIKAATCTASGTTKYACTREGCTETKTETVDALGHSPVEYAAKAATCTTGGNKLYYKCKNCNKVFNAADCKVWVTYKSRLTAALGHSWDEGKITTAPTCTTTGIRTYTCTREGCTETKTETVAALGHSPVEYKAKAATCTTAGNKLYYKCKNCNKVFNAADCKVWVTYKSRIIAALGHTGGTANCVEKAVCTRCNTEYGEIDSNTHKSVIVDEAIAATCTTAGMTSGSHCEACNTVIIERQESEPALGHTGGTANCVEKAVCTRCKTAYGTTNPKIHKTVVTDKAVTPTCTTSGLSSGKHCTACKVVITRQRNLSALGHTGGTANCIEKAICTRCQTAYGDVNPDNHKQVVTDEINAPDCVTEGTACIHCEACNTVIDDSAAIPPLGHTGGIANCVDKAVCTRCETPYGDVDGANHKNVVDDEAVAPTCTTEGKEAGTHCAACNTVIIAQNSIAALGHVWDEGEITSPATCTEAGVRTKHCTRENCDATTEVPVDALGHIEENIVITKQPTCSAQGAKEYYCPQCKQTLTGTVAINPDNHDYTVTGNVYNKDVRTLVCNYCGKKDVSAASFNQLINAVRTPSFVNAITDDTFLRIHTMNLVSKSTTKSTCTDFDFGLIWTSQIKKLYEDEMNSDEVSYSPLRQKLSLLYLPMSANTSMGNTIASLDEGDATITVSKIKSLNTGTLLANFDSTFTVGSTSYDISSYKAKTITGDILKVSAKTKTETFFGTNGVSKLNANTKTAMQKITGYDIREDAETFTGDGYSLTETDSGSGYEMNMKMKLKQITSYATVTYYFEASTLKPIAATYDMNVAMDQDIDMDITIGIVDVDGTMAPTVTTTTNQVYLFSDFYG